MCPLLFYGDFILSLMENLVCLCLIISAANIQADQKTCGPIRNKVCCLGGVSIPPLFKGASQLHRVSAERTDSWVDRETGWTGGRKDNDG